MVFGIRRVDFSISKAAEVFMHSRVYDTMGVRSKTQLVSSNSTYDLYYRLIFVFLADRSVRQRINAINVNNLLVVFCTIFYKSLYKKPKA